MDTIAAISTPYGPGAIGMVRLSGSDALAVAGRVFRVNSGMGLLDMEGYCGALGRAYDGELPVDDVVAFVYRAPKSYTGEDIVELCCHGGTYAVSRLLRLCLDAGAEPAGPGEFTRRAFRNGKMDLTQAEAVMDLIGAQGESAMRAALAARDGALSKEIGRITGMLLRQSAHIAAWSDYPDEDLAPVNLGDLTDALEEIGNSLSVLLASCGRAGMLREGITAAIVGKPNVGKSTLMNLLSGRELSIVTEIPGTTRDIVQDSISVGGVAIRLMDTAGIRESDDTVERIGVQRSLSQMDTADIILAVFDRSDVLDEGDRLLLQKLLGKRAIAVLNKTDIVPRLEEDEIRKTVPKVAAVSAKTGEGRDLLEEMILSELQLSGHDPSAAVLAGERQRLCAQSAFFCVREALDAARDMVTLDAVGVCIDAALGHLLVLTGQNAPDAVVDEVFSQFCVGK